MWYDLGKLTTPSVFYYRNRETTQVQGRFTSTSSYHIRLICLWINVTQTKINSFL